MCRMKLYMLDEKDTETDETPKPNQKWKSLCAKCILPQVSQTCMMYMYTCI